MENNKNIGKPELTEKEFHAPNGLAAGVIFVLLYIAAFVGVVCGGIMMDEYGGPGAALLFGVSLFWIFFGWILFRGIKIVRPNEARVFLFFGNYKGSLKKPGIFLVNPFYSEAAFMKGYKSEHNVNVQQGTAVQNAQTVNVPNKRLSLKAMTLNNDKQKINDLNGNPVEVVTVVIWRITDTAKAAFAVEDFMEFISIQADSTVRDVASKYPYDSVQEGEKSLRASSAEVAQSLKAELQKRVEIAGIEILEARITHLAYAPEIAAAMLQRQQAAAVIDARQKIVEGAVSMVEMALDKINENNLCELDEERKAHMVSNLLVVLCGSKDAQPVINSGTLY